MRFLKMHGAGNDYVFCDGFTHSLPQNPDRLAAQVSDRRRAIGSDGLVFLVPPPFESPQDGTSTEVALASNSPSTSSGRAADVWMRMWNADGSEGLMCGNAARCAAYWMKRQGRVTNVCRIQVGFQIVVADVSAVNANSQASDDVSIQLPAPLPLGRVSLNGIEGLHEFAPLLVDVEGRGGELSDVVFCDRIDCGNQHAVVFVTDLTDSLVQTLGPIIEHHAEFPDRVNVEFVVVRGRRKLDVRVWERGSGETLACGSGACAAAVSAIVRGECESGKEIDVVLPGGVLPVRWNSSSSSSDPCQQEDGAITLGGPVSLEFEGVWQSR